MCVLSVGTFKGEAKKGDERFRLRAKNKQDGICVCREGLAGLPGEKPVGVFGERTGIRCLLFTWVSCGFEVGGYVRCWQYYSPGLGWGS